MTLLAPMALIAVWGGAFVYSLAVTLSAPDRPLDFRYKSRGGELKLTAQSYALDFVHGNLTIQRPVLVDPAGKTLASAEFVEALNLYATPSSGRVISIRARRVRAKLVRLGNGVVPLFDYLPKPSEKPSDVPFHVQVDRFEADVEDYSGSNPWTQHVSTQRMVVDGVGQRWVAGGMAALSGIGNVAYEAQGLEKSGFLVRVDSPSLDLTKAFHHFASTPDARKIPALADFKAESLHASGPLTLYVRSGGHVDIESRLDITGRGVQYRREPRADYARFTGYLTVNGVNGTLEARNASARAVYVGSAAWNNGITFGGDLEAHAASRKALGPALETLLPKEIQFTTADYRGWLAYDEKNGVRLDGAARASKLTVHGETIGAPEIQAHVNRREAGVILTSASWRGAVFSGQGRIDFGTSKTIAGSLRADNLSLGEWAKSMGVNGLTGMGSVEAFLGGTLGKPTAEIRAQGRAGYFAERGGKTVQGDFEAAGNVSDGKLHIERSVFRSEAGTFSAKGTFDIDTREIALNVAGAGLSLNAVSDALTGSGMLKAVVTGTIGKPVAEGRAELYGASYRDWQVPVLAADFRADRQKVNASDIRAVSGASEAKGDATLTYGTGALSGTLNAVGVQLNDVFKSGVTGTIDISHAALSGTLSDPVVDGIVKGQTIVADGVKVDSASAQIALRGKRIMVEKLEAKAADGTLTGTGSYSLVDGSGTLDATLAGVSIGQAIPDLGKRDIVIDGTLDGKANVALSAKGVVSATGQGALHDVVLNQTYLGDGPWRFGTTGDQIRGSLQIGELERFIEINDLAFDTKTHALSGGIDALQIQLADIYKIASPYLASLSPDNRERLGSLTGTLDGRASFKGTWPDLELQVPDFNVQSLAMNDRPMGSFASDFGRIGSEWTVRRFSWQNGDSALNVRGRINPTGDISLDGELSKFDLSNLSLFDGRFGSLSGSSDLSFLVTGPAKSPEIDASFKSDRFQVGNSASDQRIEFGMLLNAIHVEESHRLPDGTMEGGIQAEGEFRYRGIVGQLSSQIPFSYQRGILSGEPLSAQIEVPARPLSTLNEFYTGLDIKRTQGTIHGLIKVFGPVDALKAEGKVEAGADVFALNGVQGTLEKANAQLTFMNDSLAFTLTGASSLGGTADISANTHLQDFGKILTSIVEGSEQGILANVVTGNADLRGFRVSQDSGRDAGSVDLTANANLELTGTLAKPAVKGSVAVSGGNVLLPGKPMEASPTRALPINPSFDVSMATDGTARVRTSAATLDLTGRGQLTGTLSNPNLNADMTVASGTLRLPTARVEIQPDGTLKLLYAVGPSGDVDARMDVNLEGQTYVTTLRFGDTIEHYQIFLGVRGDLFKEGGLQLTATSDPPDLSQDRILALLGQTDVLQAFTGGVSAQDAQKQIRTALTGIAVPVLFDPITSRLASSLGLQYLNVEFNAYEEATFAFAKVMGRNLVLQGRRQLSEPVVGARPTYDIRLTYRLPFSKGVLNRTSLSVGADQDRPWKIAVEYGVRF